MARVKSVITTPGKFPKGAKSVNNSLKGGTIRNSSSLKPKSIAWGLRGKSGS